MGQSRHLRRAALTVGALLLAFTALDLAVATWPPRPAELMWRYGTFNTLGGSLLTPFIGVLLLLAVAESGRSPRLHFALSATLALVAVVLAGACLPFMLDAVQLRAGVHPEALGQYDVGVARSLLKVAAGAFAAAVIAVLALRAGRAASKRREASGRMEQPLVASPTAGSGSRRAERTRTPAPR